jgi:hypothetical protein
LQKKQKLFSYFFCAFLYLAARTASTSLVISASVGQPTDFAYIFVISLNSSALSATASVSDTAFFCYFFAASGKKVDKRKERKISLML